LHLVQRGGAWIPQGCTPAKTTNGATLWEQLYRFLMKFFQPNNIEIIPECRRYFQFNLPSELIEKKKTKFEENYNRYQL